MIPKQLHNPEFRFVLLRTKDKIPFEKDWTNKGYAFDNPKLLDHIKKGGNYGVIGGYGNLRMLDIDDLNKVEEFKENFGNTFMVQTGSGGLHFYFISEYDINNVLANGLGEFRAKNYQCVGSGSTHPNGKKYKIIGDNPILELSKEVIQEMLKPFLKDNTVTTTTTTSKDTSGSGLEFRRVLAMIREGKSREVIYKELEKYTKWASSGNDYKNTTYNKAYDIFLQSKEQTTTTTPTEEDLKILKDKNFLEIINKEFDKKIVKEENARKTIFMITNMRNVSNLGKATDNLMVNAVSGTGKDYIVESIFELIPNKEKEELIRTTPKVLAYTRNRNIDENASWKKCVLRLEDASNEVLNDDSFKVFSSANPNKVNYGKTVTKGKVVEIEIDGKPSIIMTIAKANPREELLRRYPICALDEGINQTKEILKRQSYFAKTGKTIDYDEDIIKAISLLKRIKVKIPFADLLVDIFNPQNVIVRTHFPRFLDYIKSSCSLYQFQREQDEEGFYVATKEDYEIARMMLAKTTSNILMIPLDKTKRAILKAFEKNNEVQEKQRGFDDSRLSVDEAQELEGVRELNITNEWLRKQLDWLQSKTFLIKDKEKRVDEAGKIISKPVFVYYYNKIQKLEIPKWEELGIKKCSNTLINKNSYNSYNTSNSGVNEVKEVFSQEKNTQKPLISGKIDVEVEKI